LVNRLIVLNLELFLLVRRQLSALRSILVSYSERGVSRSISLPKIHSLETRIGCFELPIFRVLLILSDRLLSNHAQFKLFILAPKPVDGRRELTVLVVCSLALVMLDSLQECASPHSNVLVLDRDHLVEVNSLPLILNLWLLVIKSHVARSKWLKMVSCAQLIIQYFELVLDLGVVRARAWVRFQFFRDLV